MSASGKPSVLMLGWEYPPLINGGLGVATCGLAEALLPSTNLTLIVPLTPSEPTSASSHLLGLNHLSADLFQGSAPFTDQLHPLVQRIPITLDPYEFVTSDPPEKTKRAGNPILSQHLRHFKTTPFQDNQTAQLYDSSLNQRVRDYASVTSQLALTHSFDLIHAHDWMTFPAALEIKKLTRKPLILHLHSTQYDRAGPGDRGWVFDLEQRTMQEADHLISVSDYTKHIISTYYAIPPEKITTIHNGLSNSGFANHPQRKNNNDKQTVVFLGRLTSQKGPDFFIDIAQRVLTERPETQFLIAGHGHKKNDLHASISYRNLEEKIKLIGFVHGKDGQDKQEFLQSADLLILPSVSEPFGLSALEAAALGTPTVLSKQSGVREILTTAPAADYHNTPTLARHVIELLNDQNLYLEQAQTQQQQAQATTWEIAAEKTLSLYQSVRQAHSL